MLFASHDDLTLANLCYTILTAKRFYRDAHDISVSGVSSYKRRWAFWLGCIQHGGCAVTPTSNHTSRFPLKP